MKRRWSLILLIAVVVVSIALVMRRRAQKHLAVVPIQDGKTMDFSSGKLVVKDAPADEAALKKSVAEMSAATANVTFAPPPKQTDAKPK